ncbi:MAG: leucine-rich repeat domain-containing protein [Ruminococcus sp.]|nr:leucine-rich repeat domain-containing protein [Ruminococcus sp.]
MKANEHLISYEISEEADGMKVVSIKANAFEKEGCYDITLPESIEYIEPLAFAGCISLENITLPKNLKFLGVASFILCNSLKNITVDCPNLICEAPVFRSCNAENVFLNFRTISSSMISSFRNIENLTFGDDVVKIGTLCANSKFMEDYNYTILETVKFITCKV